MVRHKMDDHVKIDMKCLTQTLRDSCHSKQPQLSQWVWSTKIRLPLILSVLNFAILIHFQQNKMGNSPVIKINNYNEIQVFIYLS